MKAVYQTNYGKHQGNCLTACVASVLELAITDLPEFYVDGEWFERLYTYCQDRQLSLTYWRHAENNPILCLDAYVIVLLELEGEDDYHAVVGRTELDSREPVTDAEVEAHAALEELAAPPKSGGVRWGWRTEIVHDPNRRGYPSIKGPVGYILIGGQETA